MIGRRQGAWNFTNISDIWCDGDWNLENRRWLLFVFGSIAAACKGDFSGLEALGKGIGFLVLLFVMLWLFTQPVLLVIVIIILVVVFFICNS